MHPGALDVLHDARHQHVDAVADGVDLDLDALEVFVHQQRLLARDVLGDRREPTQLGRVATDLHRPSTEHERRPHQHRVAQLIGEPHGFFGRGDDAAGRLRDPEIVQQIAELVAILGDVDGVQVGAEQPMASVHQRFGQVDRRLPAELRQDRGRLPASAGLVVEHVAHRLLVEWLEVQSASRRRSRC